MKQRDIINDIAVTVDDIGLVFGLNTKVAGVQHTFHFKGSGALTAIGDFHQGLSAATPASKAT